MLSVCLPLGVWEYDMVGAGIYAVRERVRNILRRGAQQGHRYVGMRSYLTTPLCVSSTPAATILFFIHSFIHFIHTHSFVKSFHFISFRRQGPAYIAVRPAGGQVRRRQGAQAAGHSGRQKRLHQREGLPGEGPCPHICTYLSVYIYMLYIYVCVCWYNRYWRCVHMSWSAAV
jgi:hypothetical protein